MLHTVMAPRGMVVAPHHLASEAGLSVLREGGNAIEAMIAAAATIAVVYPHMNAVGGDGFWLIAPPGGEPIGIEACGFTGAAVTPDLYKNAGLSTIPFRGPMAANTVAGTIGGWGEAHALSGRMGGRHSLERLLEDATYYAENGVAVTAGQEALVKEKLAELQGQPGFADQFLDGDAVPKAGTRQTNSALARTLRSIATAGTDDFYRGTLAKDVAADLATVGSPVTAEDLAAYHPRQVTPLTVGLQSARIYNMPPPTQGLASLAILALFDRLQVEQPEGFDFVHGLVEATKRAFRLRDRYCIDPDLLDVRPQALLEPDRMAKLAADIDMARALPWPDPSEPGDTIWMGAIDGNGMAVSFIQSTYWEFGSGVVLPQSGIVWQNRGASFALAPNLPRSLAPRRKPFHTLNPALARLADGRVMSYGTMGGDGQPQTQAAVFSRIALYGQDPQTALTAPRWLLGRTWGDMPPSLKLESRFDPSLAGRLREAGHVVDVLEPFTSTMGHAGALFRTPDGMIHGGVDPRSDGVVAAF